MKEETKKAIKTNVATGASTAAGATMGVVAGSMLTPETAKAEEIQDGELQGVSLSDTEISAAHESPHAAASPVSETETPQFSDDSVEVVNVQQPQDEVEVLGYERVTAEDGSMMDLAVINVEGNEVGFVDLDLDGEADVVICDVNQNGIIEEGEIENIHGAGVSMLPLQEVAGFNPLYAENDLPDYVNDADVDVYTV